jgi:hypothetical protein
VPPRAVLEWFLGEGTNIHKFNIGGIDAKGLPMKAAATIIYFEPFKINVQIVSIHFAHVEGVAAHSILGPPFL